MNQEPSRKGDGAWELGGMGNHDTPVDLESSYLTGKRIFLSIGMKNVEIRGDQYGTFA
jgi:hypothetical protein